MTTAIEILQSARQLIADGWTQGTFKRMVDGRPCYCPIGAVSMVVRGTAGATQQTFELTAEMHAIDALRICVPSNCAPGLVAYNDTKGRTQEEVVTLFDEAIKLTILLQPQGQS